MSNQFMNNDQEEEKLYRKMIVSCVAAASLVVLLFLIMLYLGNVEKKKTENKSVVQKENSEEEEFVYGQSNVVSSDLDFWDMYDDNETDESTNDEESGTTTPYKKGKNSKSEDKNKSGESGDESMNIEDNDLGSSDERNNDDNHLAVTDEEGKTIYYEILDSVDKNNYKMDSCLVKNTEGFAEYKDNDKTSKTGISLNKNSGEVDFSKVKASKIDFCMIRIGARGDSSGVVALDENFVGYANAAKANGIYIGAIFDSAAVSVDEAVEEASFAVGAGNNYGLRYPIAIELNGAGQDSSSRNAKLTMKERTAVVKAFCDTVKQYNYIPAIKANRGTLISKLNLEDLNGIDIWVSDYSYPTDYPYEFKMWQYSNDIKVDGCGEGVPISISFVDYSEK